MYIHINVHTYLHTHIRTKTYELAYYNSAVHRFNHYTTRTHPRRRCTWMYTYVHQCIDTDTNTENTYWYIYTENTYWYIYTENTYWYIYIYILIWSLHGQLTPIGHSKIQTWVKKIKQNLSNVYTHKCTYIFTYTHTNKDIQWPRKLVL